MMTRVIDIVEVMCTAAHLDGDVPVKIRLGTACSEADAAARAQLALGSSLSEGLELDRLERVYTRPKHVSLVLTTQQTLTEGSDQWKLYVWKEFRRCFPKLGDTIDVFMKYNYNEFNNKHEKEAHHPDVAAHGEPSPEPYPGVRDFDPDRDSIG